MADGATAVGVAGAGASLLPVLFGRGKNNMRSSGWYGMPGYDPNASEFGGYAGGLRDYRADLARRRAEIDSRGAFQADYGQANWDRAQAGQARMGQQTIADAIGRRALGQAPTVAEQIGQRQMGQAVSTQNALASSARGRAGLALAGRQRAAAVANTQSGISNQTAINAAQERQAAEGAAFGAYSGMRQGDQSSEGLAGQRAQFQTQMQQRNRETNDQRAGLQDQLEGQALGQSLGAKVQNQGTLAASQTAANVANQRSDDQNAQSKGLIESIGDFFSDRRAKYVLSDFTTKLMPGGGYEGAVSRASSNIASSGSRWGGHYGSGADAMGAGGSMNTGFGAEWQNSELSGMTSDMTAGMSNSGIGVGSIMSDERAKREAYLLGRAHQMEAVAGGSPDWEYEPKKGEDIVDKGINPEKHPEMRGDRPRPQMIWHRDQLPQAQRMRREDKPPAPTPANATQAGPQSPPPRAPQQPSLQENFTASAQDAVRTALGPAFWPSETKAVPAQITSDFTAKMRAPLKPGSKRPPEMGRLGPMKDMKEEPGSGLQSQFVPGRGWVQSGANERDSEEELFDADTRATVEEDNRRRETAALAAQGDAPYEQWERSFGPMSKATDAAQSSDNRAEAMKIRSNFDQSLPGDQQQPGMPTWLAALQGGANGLSQAQFGSRGSFGSDFDTKLRTELDQAQNGEQQRLRDTKTFKRDAPEDQAKVRKAYLDRAGSKTDTILTKYKHSLNEGASVGPVDELDDVKPSRSPVAQANRTMTGQPYVYKPQFTPPDQRPGEPNFGFMAQNLEKSPITATAVKEDPAGLKRVDAMKLLRILGASVADLQKQEDETRLALGKGGTRPKKRAA